MKAADLPPGYIDLVKRLIVLIEQWCGEQPGLPDLQWHDPGDTAFIGALRGDALKWLAKTPDAIRLLEWLDVQTDHKATLIQATVALRHLGHLPGMPPEDVVRKSAGMQAVEDFAFKRGTDTRLPASPCPHCGKGLDGHSGEKGHAPKVGDVSICVYCFGFNQYGEGLVLERLTEAELDTLPAENRAQLLEMRDLLRVAKTGGLKSRGVKA